MCVTQDENLAWTVNDTLDLVADLSSNAIYLAINGNQISRPLKCCPKSCNESPKIFPKKFSQSRRLDQNWKKTNCEEERRPRHWIRVWCALLKRSTEIFLNSNRKSLHKLNFSHQDWFGEMNTHKTMALEEVLDGVLVKEVVLLVDAELFKRFRYLAQEDLLRKYLH